MLHVMVLNEPNFSEAGLPGERLLPVAAQALQVPETELTLVGEASSVKEAIPLLATTRVDCLLVVVNTNVSCPDHATGYFHERVKRLHRYFPGVRIEAAWVDLPPLTPTTPPWFWPCFIATSAGLAAIGLAKPFVIIGGWGLVVASYLAVDELKQAREDKEEERLLRRVKLGLPESVEIPDSNQRWNTLRRVVIAFAFGLVLLPLIAGLGQLLLFLFMGVLVLAALLVVAWPLLLAGAWGAALVWSTRLIVQGYLWAWVLVTGLLLGLVWTTPHVWAAYRRQWRWRQESQQKAPPVEEQDARSSQ